jgi:hypothetical protein
MMRMKFWEGGQQADRPMPEGSSPKASSSSMLAMSVLSPG